MKIKRGDDMLCVSTKVDDFMESTCIVTIGKHYKCISIWQSHNKEFASIYDDDNCYRNFMLDKFIKNGENFRKKRFELLLSR